MALPNCSATAVVNGYTVEEPTMRIWSRADAAPANAAKPTAAAVEKAMNLVFTLNLHCLVDYATGAALRQRLIVRRIAPVAMY